MKDLRRRIVCWFTLLVEYEFEIIHRARRDDDCAEFPCRPIKMLVIDDNEPFEANLEAIAHCLDNLSVVDETI